MNIFHSFLLLCLTLSNQGTKYDFDNIRGCSFYIQRTGSNHDNKSKTKACKINSLQMAEQLFGKCNKSRSFKDELFDENMTVVTYNDGLELRISDDYKNLFNFKISSNNYYLLLENGKEIKTGMTLEEFKFLFPKSYNLRSISSKWGYQTGKTKIVVFFSFINAEKKMEIADSWLIFTFDNKTGSLGEYQSFVPG